MALKNAAFLILSIFVTGAIAAEPVEQSSPTAIPSIEELTQRIRKSVVVVTVSDRDGQHQALGTGFVVSSNGLIATNFHVIGEARPIQIRFDDGQQVDVTSVHASDRLLDLALLKVERNDLPVLELGNSDQVRQGQDCLAMGNPRGLEHSVVRGVVSGIRTLDSRKMIQIAIPIEQGNSGGPLIDREGHVIGILTIKSAITPNLGFAVMVNDLKRLVDHPNPIPLSRWLTIGALDQEQWKTLFGARWQQRGGRILVNGAGSGFGGRALCLANQELPDQPYELGVKVKLGDETGAAGLVFHCDTDQRHYGFYPSNGRLRLSRFDGPDVFTWNVLEEQHSEHYRPGDWNHLKVRFEADGRLLCSVNDHVVIESKDHVYRKGQVGLAKFRHTTAEFRNFRLAKQIPASTLAPEQLALVEQFVESLVSEQHSNPEQLDEVAALGTASSELLRKRAKLLEANVDRLRRVANKLHTRRITAKLSKINDMPIDEIDLVQGALWIAALDDEDVDGDHYVKEINKMATEMLADLPQDATDEQRLQRLNQFLYEDNGFHGSRTDYYHPANSYLNRVIDDREGIPITLSLLYIELGRRIDLNLVGVGLPGHFMVALVDQEEKLQLIDAFDGGQQLSHAEAKKLVFSITGQPLQESQIIAVDQRSILVRMLRNLLGIAEQNLEVEDRLRYLDALLAIDESLVGERGQRILAQVQTGDVESALRDLDWFLENNPAGIDMERIRSMRTRLAAQNK